jgi:hypothetical protein
VSEIDKDEDSGCTGSSAVTGGLGDDLGSAQMVLPWVQGVDVPAIAKVAFINKDRARGNDPQLQRRGFGSLYPSTKAVVCRNSSRPKAAGDQEDR